MSRFSDLFHPKIQNVPTTAPTTVVTDVPTIVVTQEKEVLESIVSGPEEKVVLAPKPNIKNV